MAAKDVLTKFEAGQLVRRRREELKLTQEDVVDNTTIPVTTYVSELENGKVSIGRSKHFPSLAKYLRLSEDDVRAINPSAVIELARPDAESPSPAAPVPPELAQAAKQYGGDFASAAWQDYLARTHFRGPRPQTAEEWYFLYQTLIRLNIAPMPGGN